MRKRLAQWGVGAILVAATAGALAFRLPDLAERPFHGDEANQAHKAGVLLETGVYRYDPVEHHGPTLYYLTLPAMAWRGIETFAESDEAAYRIVAVIFGTGLMLLLWPLTSGLGRVATVVAAILTAVSPAMVYYSRYYIQEMLLVFFTFAAIVAGWRYTVRPGFGWAVAAGASVGLMHATKETAVLAWAAAAGALVLTAARSGLRPTLAGWREKLNGRHAAAAVAAAILVSVTFYTSFFTNPRGALDSILTYGNYLERAEGAGIHDKPWHYYLQTLIYAKFPFGPRWSEGLIVGLAAVGFAAAMGRRAGESGDPRLLRFLAFYTLLLTVIYALIPYKTPWCVLSFLHGMILLAGVGAAFLLRRARVWPLQTAAVLLLAVGMYHLGQQAHRASYVYAADMRNPYVYAHPVPDVLRLAQRAEDLAKVHPAGHGLVVKVISPGGDYWPLPWYLRRFERVGYWAEVPENPDADFIIVANDLQPELEKRLENRYQVEFYGLRPNVILLGYIQEDLWDRFMEGRR